MLSSPSPWQPLIFLSLWIRLLCKFHINGILRCAASCVFFSFLSLTLSRFIRVGWSVLSVLRVLRPVAVLYGRIKYAMVRICHILFVHSSEDGHVSCSYLSAYWDWCHCKYPCASFVWTPVFNSLGHISRNGLLDHIVIPCLTFWGATTLLFPTAAVPFHRPTSPGGVFQFLLILINTCCFPMCVFFFPHYYRHLSDCKVASHCGSDLHDSDDWWCWA